MNRTTTIAVSKSRESEFPPTEERSAVSSIRCRDREIAPTEDPLVTNPLTPLVRGTFSVVELFLD